MRMYNLQKQTLDAVTRALNIDIMRLRGIQYKPYYKEITDWKNRLVAVRNEIDALLEKEYVDE